MDEKTKYILSKCDHTYLAQDAVWDDIKKICDDGLKYGTASVCIPPSFVKRAKDYVGDRLAICTVVGFPNGYTTSNAKQFETRDALNNGADEIDMVINVGALKEGRLDYVRDEIATLKTKTVPRLKDEIEAAIREGESYHSDLISAQHDLVKSKADYNALAKTREEELAASDELKINGVRQRLHQLVVTQRFSLARQILTTEQLRSPRLETWCTEMQKRIDFLDRVYAVFANYDTDLDKFTDDQVKAAYAELYGDDGRSPETILCAFEFLRGNYNRAYQLRPEDPEITATADAVAEELVSAARTLHAMGEKKLPAMFANTMARLPKTPQTTAAASTIGVLFSGFPQKN